MELIRVPAGLADPEILEKAALALAAGGLLIFPTDTLYALGGPAHDGQVAQRVRAAKVRDDGKPLPVVAADLAQVRSLAREWPPFVDRLAARFWPGPLTLVLRAAPGVPEELASGTGTIAVRVPALELTRQLCRRLGPLISTSANRSGSEPPQTCGAALAHFPGLAGLALDGGPGHPRPSTIIDLTSSPARLLREGNIAWPLLEEILHSPESC